jgi:hypothetical protein
MFTLERVDLDAIVYPAELVTSIIRACEGPVVLGLPMPANLTPYYLLLSVKTPKTFTVYFLIVQIRLLSVNCCLHIELFDYNYLLVVKLNSIGKVMVRISV